jgi:hypothetical protein
MPRSPSDSAVRRALPSPDLLHIFAPRPGGRSEPRPAVGYVTINGQMVRLTHWTPEAWTRARGADRPGCTVPDGDGGRFGLETIGEPDPG